MSIISRQFIGNLDFLDLLTAKFSNNSFPNSILLSGPKGIGKNTFAYNLVKNIFEKKVKDNIDQHINLIYNYTHDNVRYLYKEFDEKTNKYKKHINVDQIRELENFIYQLSLNNLPKIIIIDSADELNNNSSNALLKILEDPQKLTFFILITHNLSNLLPTIKSRCVKFYLENPSISDFKKILLIQNYKFQSSEIDYLYDLSFGSPGVALNLYSANIIENIQLTINLFKNNVFKHGDILNLSTILSKLDNDQFQIFISVLKFILLSVIKINFKFNFSNTFKSNILESLEMISSKLNSKISFKMLEYLNYNENDLFTYNLDKKLFILNFFTLLDKET